MLEQLRAEIAKEEHVKLLEDVRRELCDMFLQDDVRQLKLDTRHKNALYNEVYKRIGQRIEKIQKDS